MNIEIIKFVQSFSNPFLDKLFQLITMMGEDYFFIMLLTIVYWCINKDFGYRLAFTYLSSMSINGAIKDILKVPRPIGQPGIKSIRVETATGYSFPSGHTQGTATFWTSLMVRAKKRWVYAVGIIAILLVGLSRIYLGVHTPVDVIGGMTIGILWVFAANWLFDRVENDGKKSILIFFAVLITLGAFFFHSNDYSKAAGVACGFVIGYFVETAYIKFQPKTVLWKQVVKYIIGLGVLIVLKVILKDILPQAALSDYFRYFVMGIWVTVLAPLVFKFLFKNN